MEPNLYVVVGNPLSDIGKGWLGGSIASTLPSTHIIKVDPLLNPLDLTKNDLIKGFSKTADAATYEQLGFSFQANQIFLHGNILLEFLENNRHTIIDNAHDTPRLTFGEVGHFFAEKICDAFTQSQKSNLVIEVGGTVTDPELTYIPRVFRIVAAQLQLQMKIILLSYLDYTEDPQITNPIKTRHVTYAIEQTRRVYGEPNLVFFRRRNLPDSIENNIGDLTDSISNRALFPKENVVYLPNFPSPVQEREFIQTLSEFNH